MNTYLFVYDRKKDGSDEILRDLTLHINAESQEEAIELFNENVSNVIHIQSVTQQ